MDHFEYKDKRLFAENVACDLLSQQYGTPCFVYSTATIKHHFEVFTKAFLERSHLICYAVKANSNLSILNLLATMGSGFDIVSIGELQRVLAAGGDPRKTVFSGVGKQDHEIAFALENNIYCFNIESEDELGRLNQIAIAQNKKAPIAIRVNPDVDPKSHPYISTGLKSNKFGLSWDKALLLYLEAKSLSHIDIMGITCHIGSQILETAPFIEAASKLNAFCLQLKAHHIEISHIDLGGGLGISYAQEKPPSPKDWISAMLGQISDPNLKVIIEPGRAMIANAGILLTNIISIKQTDEKQFAIVDAGMNDLLRPALYNAYQEIIPATLNDQRTESYDIVGPICETGDFLGTARMLPKLETGDILCIRGAGAYGFVMSSNYNSRPKAAEVMVQDDQSFCVRPRETVFDLYQSEQASLVERGIDIEKTGKSKVTR